MVSFPYRGEGKESGYYGFDPGSGTVISFPYRGKRS